MSFSGFFSYCSNAAVILQKKSFGFSQNPPKDKKKKIIL
jgi:hypothetical protein